MSGHLENASPPRVETGVTARGAWRTVAILTLLYWFGTLDRQIAALLVPLIKADLQLSDLQISLVQGLAFGLFFMLASPLMGWLVDRYSRRTVLFAAVNGWCTGALASGLSRSFGQLFAARSTVGAFEAAINPSAYAMLSELFPPRKLALPMSIFVLGGNLGSGMSFLLGGVVVAWIAGAPPVALPLFGTLSGWQTAFLMTAIPGFLFAPLIWFARESRLRSPGNKAATSFFDLWQHVRRHVGFFALHNVGFGLVMAFVVGLQSWNAAFLSRAHGWTLPEIGLYMGLFQVVSAILGLAFHGWAVDRLFSRGHRDAHLRYFALMSMLALPCGVGAYLVPSGMGTVILFNLAYFLLMAFASIGPAALQIATPVTLRGKASAVYMVVISIIGTILGPIVVATFTDMLFKNEASLGHSMALFAGLTTGGAALLLTLGRGPMRRAIAEALPITEAARHSSASSDNKAL